MNDSAHEPPDPEPTGLPRWLKVSGLALLIVALLVAVFVFLVGGDHGGGPSRH